MKLTIFFTLVACLSVSANGLSQNVSFSGRNVPLERVLEIVEKQTGYVFLYPENALSVARPVSIQANNKPLLAFLEELFERQPFRYSIESKTINISTVVTTNVPARKPALELQLYTPAPPVSGRVTDSLGKPIAGVTISVVTKGRGTYAATTTDSKGAFEIIAAKGDKLTFSIVGYEPVTITINNQTEVNVVMQVKASELDEFVVKPIFTGYQRIRPEQSTGAVSQISTKEYESRVSTNFLDGLVNRMPGLMINNNVSFTSTAPNGGTTSRALFNIRGISTMSANQNPLIVVDGYPTELTLDLIDPNEIKSVTILKDAAAATVYGVRASNGVIVIERKQASLGMPRFAFRATTGITPQENYSRYRWADNASAIVTNYQKTINAASVNEGTWSQLATAAAGTVQRNQVYYITAQLAAKMITPEQAAESFAALDNYNNVDDYSRLFLRPAVTQTYNLNVSGGTGNALYYITANHTRNRLSIIGNDNNRTLFSARTTLKLASRLSLELTTDYQENNIHGTPVPGIGSVAPYEHFQDVNGKPASIVNGGISPYYNSVLVANGLYDQLYYPLVDVKEISDDARTINNRFTANFNYVIGGGFDLSFGGIYETSRAENRYLASENSSVARKYVNSYVTQNTDGTFKYNIPRGGYLSQENTQTSSYTARAQLNFNKRIGGLHSVNAILGGEIRNLINKANLASYFGYNDGTLLQQPVDYASIINSSLRGHFGLGSPLAGSYYFPTLFNQAYTEDRFLSGYSNIVYSFKNTYSLTGSMRIDQSNLFGTNPKYKYKPLWSVGAAWNIHKESFMQDIDWIKMLKLRMAYGFNGNVAKMSLPQVIATSQINSYTAPTSASLRLLSYANSSLRWEQTKNFNLGLDYHIFKNITGTLDYYQKRSTDLLGNAQIDPTIGVSPSLINRATINNTGIEIGLHADWVSTRNLNWNTGLVIARNTSKVLEVYRKGDFNPQTLNALGYVMGHPVGAMFAFNYLGLDSTGHPLVGNNRGQVYHTNVASSSSPSATAMKSDSSGLTRYMGSSIPTISAGLSNRIDVGNFYFFCMINYYGGFKVRVPRPNPGSLRPMEGAGDFWRVKGDELNTDVMALTGYTNYNAVNPYNYADKYVVNGDYITLSDVTVSYSLDNLSFVKRTGFSHFEVKCQASNLWTIGLNEYNYSMATNSYEKSYITPTYTIGIFTNF
ncbi:MAG: SusC/RagA family TonB-linked outer membrane protein [Candidatus Pseudobacter hemicellulosilyticus]|uniref:SusC/RagA family TonB-linked outer membrane protein n=1 Tax=Candidatus Pseudobacter hemicellulosilyticus TaxID=3121375 RepID=A0AAJ5WSQ0_9BACT|nr:MAG: SusC/RagA family TonB-linked outer membrane protein [Pseudobacter sp.]